MIPGALEIGAIGSVIGPEKKNVCMDICQMYARMRAYSRRLICLTTYAYVCFALPNPAGGVANKLLSSGFLWTRGRIVATSNCFQNRGHSPFPIEVI